MRAAAILQIIAVLLVLIFCRTGEGKDLGTVGNIYDIKERDLLEEIYERASKVDWEKMAREAGERAKEKIGKVNKRLPKALKNSTYYIDLTTTLNHNIHVRDKAGNPKLLYPKGFRYNALDYVNLKQRYIFFDAERPEEIAFYKEKYANDPNVMPIISNGNALDISKEVKREVYILDGNIASRFELRATPTLVYQSGNKLRADVFYIKTESGQ